MTGPLLASIAAFCLFMAGAAPFWAAGLAAAVVFAFCMSLGGSPRD